MGNSQPNTKDDIENDRPVNIQEFKKKLEEQLETVPPFPSPDAEVIKTPSGMPTKSALHYVRKIELHAVSIKGKNEYTVNASDGRKKVLEPTKWPNSVHGVIAFKVDKITTWGTGVLIGPHIVLTAGHNLYDFEDTKTFTDIKSLQFLPGVNGAVLPFGVIEVEQYFVSPNYIAEGKDDYGILILKKPVGEVAGYFGLACLKPEEITAKRINVTGYPSDKVADKPNVYEMWGMEGEASHIDQDQGRINYLIDTERGQSGSGVWYQEGENYYVCGVHITGTKFVNTATLLTRAMYRQIHAWVQQVGFQEFPVRLGLGDRKMLGFLDQDLNGECISTLIKYNLDDLKHLALWKLGNKGAKTLAQDTSWINLSVLNLSYAQLSAEGAKALSQNTSWVNLSVLNLSWNTLGSEGAKALAQNTSWSNLSQLDLTFNNIDSEGVRALAQNTSWINLSELNLSDNNIGVEGAKALAQNTSWVNLSELDLSNYHLGIPRHTPKTSPLWLSRRGNLLSSSAIKVLQQNGIWKKNIRIRWQ